MQDALAPNSPQRSRYQRYARTLILAAGGSTANSQDLLELLQAPDEYRIWLEALFHGFGLVEQNRIRKVLGLMAQRSGMPLPEWTQVACPNKAVGDLGV